MMNSFEQPSQPLSPLKLAYLKLQQSEKRIRQLEAARREPIAIVGMGCRMPGAEGGPEAFWRLIRDQRCAVSGGLEQRFRTLMVPADLPEAARSAALLEHVDMFDPQHFGISPREAATMDPQQRLLLEVSWEALENGGIDPFSLYKTSTGVYIGITSHDYAQLQLRGGNLGSIHGHFASGAALSVAAGRISYTLGLNGPAISVDTACSSSLVAVHLACEALRSQECSLALAGGVNLILAPEASVAFAETGMLSQRGICSPFLDAADGFVRGEGCGLVVLKRLSDAEAAGDRVLAVIAGSAVNQDGASSGLTAPNGMAQQALLREAHRRANIDPSEIGYVETHGTGTRLGDPIEAEALGAAFGDRSEKLLIGSVKANVGHLESAAGIAGLIKLVKCLEHGEIPGQVSATSLNEHIRWEELPLEVPAVTRSWQAIGDRRVGGVSSFGFSGTNAHVVVEEYLRKTEPPREDGDRLDALCLSARTKQALRDLAEKYAAYLKGTSWSWNEICSTARTGRAALTDRLAVVASSRDAAAAILSDWLQGKVTQGLYPAGGEASCNNAPGSEKSTPHIVANLFVTGESEDWRSHESDKGLRRAELPTYSFQRERFWFEKRDQFASPVEEPAPTGVKAGKPAPAQVDLRLLMARIPAEQRLGTLREYLKAEVGKVLEIDPGTPLNADEPLIEMGLDSLMALELKNSLQQCSGVKLPASFLFEYPTIADAANYLNAIISPAESQSDYRHDPSEFEGISL